MKRTRDLWIGAAFLILIAALTLGQRILATRAVAEAAGAQAPMFEVDPLWPKPLPNHWILGNTIGVTADAQDHIWIIHRQGSLDLKETAYAVANDGKKLVMRLGEKGVPGDDKTHFNAPSGVAFMPMNLGVPPSPESFCHPRMWTA